MWVSRANLPKQGEPLEPGDNVYCKLYIWRCSEQANDIFELNIPLALGFPRQEPDESEDPNLRIRNIYGAEIDRQPVPGEGLVVVTDILSYISAINRNANLQANLYLELRVQVIESKYYFETITLRPANAVPAYNVSAIVQGVGTSRDIVKSYFQRSLGQNPVELFIDGPGKGCEECSGFSDESFALTVTVINETVPQYYEFHFLIPQSVIYGLR